MDLTAETPGHPRPSGEPAATPPEASSAAPTVAGGEVTLAFAVAVDPQGRTVPLSHPQVLATLLCAVDHERGRAGRLGGGGLRLEALAPLYFPIVVVPAPEPGRFAVFDGVGVWRQTFQRSLMPPVERLSQALAAPPPTSDRAGWLRTWASTIAGPTGAESMAVEGSFAAQQPLFADILRQSVFRIDPATEHPGFLPTRRSLEWYGQVVEEISRAIYRSDAELRAIGELKEAVDRVGKATIAALSEERRQLQYVDGNRARVYAHEEMDREADAVARSQHDQIRKELDSIRSAHAQIAAANASSRVAEAQLAHARPRSPEAETAHRRLAEATESRGQAEGAIASAHARIEAIHERERQAYRVLADRVAAVEQRTADGVAAHELLRTDLLGAAAELTAALEAQAALRTSERQAMSAQFIDAPSLQGVRVLWLPIWVATLVGDHAVRTIVFPPMRVRSAIGAGDSLKALFGGVVLPLEPMTAGFGTSLKGTLEQAIASDPWLYRHVRDLVKVADTTADPDFLLRLANGLKELRLSGWLTAEQERRYFLSSEQLLRGRPVDPVGHGPTGPAGGVAPGPA